MLFLCFIVGLIGCTLLRYRMFSPSTGGNQCTDEHIFDYYFFKAKDDYYCSEIIFSFKDSVKFRIVNTTMIAISFYSNLECQGDETIVGNFTLSSCMVDPIINSEGSTMYSMFTFISETDLPNEVIGKGEIVNPKEWLKVSLYDDNKCEELGKSWSWEVSWLRMNSDERNVGFAIPFFGTNPAAQFTRTARNTTQQLRKMCNSSVLYQFVEGKNLSKNENSITWDEVIIMNLEGGCHENHMYGRLTTPTTSFKYECGVEPYIPTGYKKYHNSMSFYNPTCFGDPYHVFEYKSGQCADYPYIQEATRMDYFKDHHRIRMYFFDKDKIRGGVATCPDENRLGAQQSSFLKDEINECRELALEKSGFRSKHFVRYSVEAANVDKFSGQGYFITTKHFESCDYYKSHPKEFDAYRSQNMIDSLWNHFIATGNCVDNEFFQQYNAVEYMDHGVSLLAYCRNGELYHTMFNSTSCNHPFPEGEKKEDFCAWDSYGSSYVTFSCVPFHCFGKPQYDSEVCTKNGKCVGENICSCVEGYSGSQCENWECASTKQDDDKVCSGHGDCTQPDTCLCDSGFGGEICQVDQVTIAVLAPTLSVLGLGTVVIFIVIVCCVCAVLCTFCFVAGIILCVLGIFSLILVTRLKKFSKLKHFDLYLKEQEMDEDDSMAHIRFSKALFELDIDTIKSIRVLGEGGSNSVVFLAQWSGKKVAFKCFKTRTLLTTQHSFDEFEREVGLLSSLNHPNIIQFFGACLKPPRVGIVMEFCPHGELLEFVIKFRERTLNPYPFMEKIRFLCEISSALEFCHSRNILHRDLKPENILISVQNTAKLMDFGISKVVDVISAQKTQRIGTCFYMAPEVVNSSIYDEKVDVYSFAILSYVVLTEMENPYLGIADEYGIENRVANNPHLRPNLNKINVPEDENWTKNLITKCWEHNPKLRSAMKDIREVLESKLELQKEKELDKNESTED